MPKMRVVWAAVAVAAAILLLRARPGWNQASLELSKPAPAFPGPDPQRWIGPPVSWAELRGKVVMLDVWSFG
jgi:hypothetical protein